MSSNKEVNQTRADDAQLLGLLQTFRRIDMNVSILHPILPNVNFGGLLGG